MSDRQIVFQLVSDCLVKDACQHFAEQPCDDKDQDNNETGRSKIDKEAACGDDSDKKAVSAHFLKAYDVFSDKAVVIDDRFKHFAKLIYD